MKYNYVISGDGTGETYGIYKGLEGCTPDKLVMIESGLISFKAAQKRIKELEKNETS